MDCSRKDLMKSPDAALCCDLPNLTTKLFTKFMSNFFEKATHFAGTNDLPHLTVVQCLNSCSIVASIEDLYGTSLHLSADLQGAKEAYENSLAIVPLPAGFEASLKLASIFVEIGTNEEVPSIEETNSSIHRNGSLPQCTAIYEENAECFSDPSKKLELAWLNIHRISYWISRSVPCSSVSRSLSLQK
jgi:hypothetical protein